MFLQSALCSRVYTYAYACAHVYEFKLTENFPMPVSPATKSNRRIQVRLSGVHGKGVFALQNIPEGERIIEYVGEIISWKEAQRRHPWNPEDPNHTFYFHVDDKRVID